MLDATGTMQRCSRIRDGRKWKSNPNRNDERRASHGSEGSYRRQFGSLVVDEGTKTYTRKVEGAT